MEEMLAKAASALASLELEEAARIYRSLTEQDDSSYEAWLGLARTLTKQRRTAAAFKAAEKCVSVDSERWEAFASLGTLAFLTDDNERAITELERAIQLNAQAPDPLLTLSQVFAEQEEFDRAREALEQGNELVAQLEDEAKRREMQAFALHVETYLLLSDGDEEAAFDKAQEVLAYREDNAHAACLAYSTLGILSWRRGEMDDAQDYLESAHDLNPYFGRSAAALGQLYYMRQNYDLAAQVLEDAVALNPVTDGATHYAYGTALAKTGRRQEAVQQFKLSVEQGLKGLPSWMARWQIVWQSSVGRMVIIMLGLAAVAAWLIWGKPDTSSITLLAAFGVFLLLRRVFRRKRSGQ